MIAPPASLDHLTVAALTLEQGVAYVQRLLGVVVPLGGAHPLMATHNCLMRIGDAVFLEIIAPDPSAAPKRPRWFSLDDPAMLASLKRSPRLISWVIGVPDLRAALGAIDGVAGEAVHVTRGSLSWLISVPPNGSMPFDGAFPTLIEWRAGPHPAGRMTDLNCRIERLTVEHPDSPRIAKALGPIFRDDRVTISSSAAMRLRAMIATPDGPRELS